MTQHSGRPGSDIGGRGATLLREVKLLVKQARAKKGLRDLPEDTVEEDRLMNRAAEADLDIEVDWLHPAVGATDDTRLYVVVKDPSEKAVLRTTDLAEVRDMVHGRLNYRPETRPKTVCTVPGCTNLGEAEGNTRNLLCRAHSYGRCWEPGCRAGGDFRMRKHKDGFFCKAHALTVCRVGDCLEQPTTRDWRGEDWACEWHLANPGGGFYPDRPGHMYLMERQGEQQVGITNHPDNRLAHHRRNGWNLVELTPAGDGYAVRDLETRIKRWLAETIGVLPGTTENWSSANLEVGSLLELMDRAGANATTR